MELPNDPAVLLGGIYTKGSRVSTGYLCTHAHGNVIHDNPTAEVPQVSMGGRIDKKNVVYPHGSMLA